MESRGQQGIVGAVVTWGEGLCGIVRPTRNYGACVELWVQQGIVGAESIELG